MGFKRIKVPVLRTDGKVEFRTGWTENGDVGYYPMKKITKNNTIRDWKYIATDMKTGARICEQATRKECISWVNSNQDKLAAARKHTNYAALIEEFQRRIALNLLVKEGF